jgi:2,3-bisphosphoglycerate-dependent phosphoglycerate mutase
MESTRILAIRHGETAWNVDTRIQGQLNIGLNNTGLWQAQQVGKALADEPIAAIYSSDLDRAFITAESIAKSNHALISTPRQTGIVQPHTGLRERHFGHFEGMTWAEIEDKWPSDAHLWRSRDPHWAPQGGESLVVLNERIAQCVDAIASQHLGEQIVLVAHGGVLDVLYRLATGQSTQAPRTWHLGNAAINRLLWTPEGLSLVGWGDVAHLQEAPQASLDESTS